MIFVIDTRKVCELSVKTQAQLLLLHRVCASLQLCVCGVHERDREKEIVVERKRERKTNGVYTLRFWYVVCCSAFMFVFAVVVNAEKSIQYCAPKQGERERERQRLRERDSVAID